MKTITVPDIGYYPIELKINNNKYTLQPGKSMSVPDEVAALLGQIVAAKPKTDPNIADKQPATVAEVKKLIAEAIAAIPEPEPDVELTELVSVTLGSSGTTDVPEGMCSAQADLTGAQISSIMGARGDLYLNDAQHELTKQTDSEVGLFLLWNMTYDDGTIALADGATSGYLILASSEGSSGVLIVISTEDVGGATVTILAAPADPNAPVVIDLSGDDSPATYDDGAYIISDAATSNAIYHAIISHRQVWVVSNEAGTDYTGLVHDYCIDESGEDPVFCATFGTEGVLKLQDYADDESGEEDDHILPTDPGASVTVILPSQS